MRSRELRERSAKKDMLGVGRNRGEVNGEKSESCRIKDLNRRMAVGEDEVQRKVLRSGFYGFV